MTTARYDTYGFTAADLESARQFVEERLEVRLRERDSSYYLGDTYYALRLPADGSIKLYANAFEGRGLRSEHRDYGVLLELSRLPDMDALRDRLFAEPSSVALLQSLTMEVADDDADEET